MKIKSIFIFAIILRLIIMPLFFHPDIKSQHFHFQYLSIGVFDIFSFIKNNQSQLPYTDTFNYLPLTYFFFGFIQLVLSPFLPADFSVWINDWSATQNQYYNLPVFLFFLKIPYLLFDLGIGFILLKLSGQKLAKLWLLNPFSLYLIYILSNFDIVPVFFSLFSLYLLKSHLKLSFFVLGIATSLKLYPLLLFPFLLFYHQPQLKKIFTSVIFFLLPIVISILPFLFSPNFFSSFTGSGLTQKLFETKIFLIPIFPLFYLAIFFHFLFFKNLYRSFLLLFLIFITTVDFHSQWLLWFFPLALLSLSNFRQYLFLFVLISIAIVYILLTNDKYLFWGHLIPINWHFINLTSPHQLIRFRFLQNPSDFQILLISILRFISPVILFLK